MEVIDHLDSGLLPPFIQIREISTIRERINSVMISNFIYKKDIYPIEIIQKRCKILLSKKYLEESIVLY